MSVLFDNLYVIIPLLLVAIFRALAAREKSRARERERSAARRRPAGNAPRRLFSPLEELRRFLEEGQDAGGAPAEAAGEEPFREREEEAAPEPAAAPPLTAPLSRADAAPPEEAAVAPVPAARETPRFLACLARLTPPQQAFALTEIFGPPKALQG